LPVFLVLFSAGFVYLLAPQAIGKSLNWLFIFEKDFTIFNFRLWNSGDENNFARCCSQRIFDFPHRNS
jgi:hypothetical protein